MKKQFLHILQEISVYEEHDISSKIIANLAPSQYVNYTREKRRNGVNWMEIYLDDSTIAYIKKERDAFHKCKQVELSDESATGFSFTRQTSASHIPMQLLFAPIGSLDCEPSKKGQITLDCVESAKENKKKFIELEYNNESVTAAEIHLQKGDLFYIVNETLDSNDIFLEIDNLEGKKGFILKKTSYSATGDKWMLILSIIIAITTVIAIFMAFLANGWLVISGLMVVAGIVVAIIAIVIINIILSILRGIFNQIRKRF